ncbi:MAG TPA: hypothetical protein VGO53_12800, partial [Steroidobacteraceae bacterium]|nr:hypothetical protein [Steroidobacteraceae bacterium]
MLLGATGQLAERATSAPADWVREPPVGGTAVLRRPWGVVTLDATDLSAQDADTGSWLEIVGNPLIAGTIQVGGVRRTDGTAQSGGTTHRARWLLAALTKNRFKALDAVEGSFALVWWDAASGRLHLLRDRFGSEPFYYTQRDGDLVFGSSVRSFALLDGRAFEIS